MTSPTVNPHPAVTQPDAVTRTDPCAPAAHKAALRSRLLVHRQQMPIVDRQAAASGMANMLRHRAEDESWQRIAVYLPWREEPDLQALWREWQRAGRVLALPVVVAANAPLEMRAWSEGATLSQDAMGLPVPAEGAVVACDAWIIPCLGVGPGGERLGAGKGLYDRSIAQALRLHPRPPRPRFIGLGFAQGLIDEPFGEPHDARLDACLTELGWRYF